MQGKTLRSNRKLRGVEDSIEIWYVPRPGLNVPRERHILLMKALYGLKPAAAQWNIYTNIYILSLGFNQLLTDSCMYVRGSYALGTLVIIVL